MVKSQTDGTGRHAQDSELSEAAREKIIGLGSEPWTEQVAFPEEAADAVDVVAVFKVHRRDSRDGYRLVRDDGSTVFTSWMTDECSACDDNEAYRPTMGTAPKRAHARQRRADCSHAAVSRGAYHLDTEGECLNCGSWAIDVREVAPKREAAFTVEYCAGCRQQRG